jgi:hypothetical protein
MRAETAGKAQAYALDDTLARNHGAHKVFCIRKLSLIHLGAL